MPDEEDYSGLRERLPQQPADENEDQDDDFDWGTEGHEAIDNRGPAYAREGLTWGFVGWIAGGLLFYAVAWAVYHLWFK